MRHAWQDIRRPRQRRRTGITQLLHHAFTTSAYLAASLDVGMSQVCMMVAALSSASRSVFLCWCTCYSWIILLIMQSNNINLIAGALVLKL
jgi:hypothetical protein